MYSCFFLTLDSRANQCFLSFLVTRCKNHVLQLYGFKTILDMSPLIPRPPYHCSSQHYTLTNATLCPRSLTPSLR